MKGYPSALATYLETLILLRRLNRRFMETVRDVIQGQCWDELTPAQLMMVYQVGLGPVKISDVFDQGFCEGVNPSYNIKKMIHLDYFYFEKNPQDRRMTMIALSKKGKNIYHVLDCLFRHQEDLLCHEGWHPGRWKAWQREIKGLLRFFQDHHPHMYKNYLHSKGLL